MFKKGDIPSNAAPVFTDLNTGHVQKYSWGLATYWNDGSLRHASFMLLPDFAVSSGASYTLNITKSTGTSLCKTDGTSGGPWPCPSSRTLTDVYNQSCIVTLPPSAVGSGLGGVTYSSWLDSAANTNNNNYKQVKWLDGDAGTAWRIDLMVSQTKTGSAQGFLRMSDYVVALNNSSGNLGGFRWLPILRNPAYNTGSTPSWYFFDSPSLGAGHGPNWSCNGGAANYIGWHGGDNNLMGTQAWTASGSSGPVIVTTASNNLWMQSHSGNPIPFYNSSLSGASPLNTTAIFFAQSNQNPVASGGPGANNNLNIYVDPEAVTAIVSGGSNIASGSGTMVPVPGIAPFSRFAFANASATYNFFQGTGSLSADSTLLMQFDQVYWHSTKTFAPWNLAIQGVSLGGSGNTGVLDSTSLKLQTSDWNEFNIADWWYDQDSGSDHTELGPFPDSAARDFYNQSAASLTAVRINGLASGLTSTDIKDATTDTVPNVFDADGVTNYTGMPLSAASTLESGARTTPSFSYPTTFTGGLQGFTFHNAAFTEHRPNYNGWAFLRDGNLYQLDMMEDQASQSVTGASKCERNTGSDRPSVSFCNCLVSITQPQSARAIVLGSAYVNEIRAEAHAFRDIVEVASLYPYDPTGTATVYNNGGTQEAKYFRDIEAANTSYTAATLNPANTAYFDVVNNVDHTPYFIGSSAGGPRGFWAGTQSCTGVQGWNQDGNVWELMYLNSYMSMAYAMLEDTNAKGFLSTYATKIAYLLNTFGGFNLYDHDEHYAQYQVGANNQSNLLINDDDHWAISIGQGSQFAYPFADGKGLIWTTSSPAFSMASSSLVSPLTLKQGTIWQFQSGEPNPPGLSTDLQAYYINNPVLSGGTWTFDLFPCNGGASGTLCTGGSPALPSSAGNAGGSPFVPNWAQWKSPPAASTGAFAGFALYVTQLLDSAEWATAVGITGFGAQSPASGVMGDASTRQANDTADFGPPYPASGTVFNLQSFGIPRYSMQGCFGYRGTNPLLPCN